MSEARTDPIEERLRHVEETAIRTEALLTATLPHLATKAELADVRTDLAKTEARLIGWLIGVGAGAVVLLSGQLWAAVQIVLHALK